MSNALVTGDPSRAQCCGHHHPTPHSFYCKRFALLAGDLTQHLSSPSLTGGIPLTPATRRPLHTRCLAARTLTLLSFPPSLHLSLLTFAVRLVVLKISLVHTAVRPCVFTCHAHKESRSASQHKENTAPMLVEDGHTLLSLKGLAGPHAPRRSV